MRRPDLVPLRRAGLDGHGHPLELRYRGLRAPHKLKSAVSGCARECAEAQSKDFGVIATERGWNLYVGGNGGMRPATPSCFAEDLDDETLIRYIDRFLMFYIRTADRLERTATWLEKLEGGIDHLRQVVVDDSLGIGAELEADMAAPRRHLRVRVEGHDRRPRAPSSASSPSSTPPTSPTRRSCSSRSAARSARPDPTSASSSPPASPLPAAATRPHRGGGDASDDPAR